jgi:hypothetical protein
MPSSKKRTVAACARDIRRINARFRRERDMPEDEADRLMTEKDRLIDEMAELCDHPRVLAAKGSRRKGARVSRPRRICARCGLCESLVLQDSFRKLAGRPTTFYPHDEYLIEEGLVLKRLGINL